MSRVSICLCSSPIFTLKTASIPFVVIYIFFTKIGVSTETLTNSFFKYISQSITKSVVGSSTSVNIKIIVISIKAAKQFAWLLPFYSVTIEDSNAAKPGLSIDSLLLTTSVKLGTKISYLLPPFEESVYLISD